MNKPAARSQRIANAALEQCGVKFRPHGRDNNSGWDCVGLAAHCVRAADIQCDIPTGYSLRGGDPKLIAHFMKLAGFGALPGRIDFEDGDIVLARPNPVQLHLMIKVACGFVHAHAGFRRVVFSPGRASWPIERVFRLIDEISQLIEMEDC